MSISSLRGSSGDGPEPRGALPHLSQTRMDCQADLISKFRDAGTGSLE